MNSIAEYLERLNSLTQQNLDILKALNDSFFTKKEHLVVNVEDNHYVIPSFIALENKVNALQEGLNNLVNAPATGEAYFNYDGNSKTIQVRGFNNTPHSVTLNTKNTERFFVEQNSIFKDFITPNAYLRFDLNNLPDDISNVIVKKITPLTAAARSLFESKLLNEDESMNSTSSVPYAELYKQLSVLEPNVDYEEYNTVRQLPIRQTLGTGTYVITKILKDEILNDLTEQLTLEISTKTPLVYKKFDETIDIDLQVGQYLTTYNDRVKLQIVDVNSRNHQLVLNVVNGDYLDLVPYVGDFESVDDVQEMSKLSFFASNDFSKDKYIDVTLEEDQYIAIFVAPLNNRMNIQAPWGNGVVVNTYDIKFSDDDTVSYETYYKDNITNIGDILKEITTITNTSITKYSKEEFDTFTKYNPTLGLDTLSVVQINRHLNSSPTIVKIRSLYSQKKQYEIDLNEIQTKINSINETLASVSFDDTTNLRTLYESQLSEYTKKKNETISAINNVINEISLAVNNSDVPIENGKYHIRGYYNWSDTTDAILNQYRSHVKGILVEYRYKNKDQVTGTAESFQNGNFLYSDWNRMEGFNRSVHPHRDVDKFSFSYDENNDKVNEPSFNQIDIPISQGESVDIRLKVVWDFGYPYIETTSDWSEIVNVEFPEEFLKDIQILTIIEENNNDIETNRFKNILIDEGVMTHVEDNLKDQDITYFHHPEHIASGFYTDERRIIPLKDKLASLDSSVVELEDVVYGTNSENIKVELIYNSTSTIIMPFQDNEVDVNIELPNIGSVTTNNINEYTHIANIQITNMSKRSIRLFSIFPGNRNTNITATGQGVYDNTGEYKIDLIANQRFVESSGGYFNNNNGYQYKTQTRNQFLYLRSKDIYNRKRTLDSFALKQDNKTKSDKAIISFLLDKNISQVCLDSNNIRDYKVLNPGESIILPIIFTFTYYHPDARDPETTLPTNYKGDLEFSFDLRMSLYNDPQNYYFRIHRVTSDTATLYNKIVESQTNLNKYDTVVAKVFQPESNSKKLRISQK